LESEQRQAVLNELDYMEKELVKLPYDNAVGHEEFAAPLWEQFVLVTQRVFQQYWRTPSYIWAKLFLSISSSIFIGFVFFNASATIQGLQNQMFSIFMFLTIFNPMLQQILPVFVESRDLYETRERPSKTFSWKAFITSQIVAEIPWNALIGTIAFFCWYYPAGFYHNASSGGTTEVNDRGAYAWFFCVLFFIYIGTMAHMCIAPMQLADMAGNISYLLFTLCLTFCGVLVTPTAMPGFWIFMYRVSPMTYFVGGYLPNAIAHAQVHCSSNEFRVVAPANNLTCGEYFSPYIEAVGTGYVRDPFSTAECEFCPLSSTDDWLASVDLNYSYRWRDLGIFCVFIVFDICAAVLFYWWARVPKKSSRVKEEARSAIAEKDSDDSIQLEKGGNSSYSNN
jgi:ATP-binding cassette subfamily G (WHITE) protein 2 (PDR)